MDPLLPGLAQFNCRDALLRVLENIGLQEVLELFFANEALKEDKELEALFIRHLAEGVVGVVSAQHWVQAAVGVVEAGLPLTIFEVAGG